MFIPSESRRRSAKSKHAQERQQQRSIPQIVIDLLQEHADPESAGGGEEILRFTKRTWRYAAADLGRQAKHFEHFRGVYLIQSQSGAVITVAWQH